MKWFLAAVLAALAIYSPELNTGGEPGWTVCAFHWLTGLDCPFCGMTRALCFLLKGHVREALGFHALSPLVLGIVLAHFGPRSVWSRIPWMAVGVLFLLFGLGRLTLNR